MIASGPWLPVARIEIESATHSGRSESSRFRARSQDVTNASKDSSAGGTYLGFGGSLLALLVTALVIASIHKYRRRQSTRTGIIAGAVSWVL